MRAPGESSGSFALESAMDELAYAANVDPIELRLRNYAETDPDAKLPFSSKSLRDCYKIGAAAFIWNRRTPAPGSMREGRMLVAVSYTHLAVPQPVQSASGRAPHTTSSATASQRSNAMAITSPTSCPSAETRRPPDVDGTRAVRS